MNFLNEKMSRFLMISLRKVSNYQEDGRIPHYRLGRAIYFKKGELMQALGLPAKYQHRNWNKQ
jgi:hypothetical protein